MVVQMGMGGEALRFPVKVSDESKPQSLNQVLPIIGSPGMLDLRQYYPDLKLDTTAQEQPEGGTVVKLRVEGPKLQQEFWLCGKDEARGSISAPVGKIMLKQLFEPNQLKTMAQALTRDGAIGVLTVETADRKMGWDYALARNRRIEVPAQQTTIEILDFMPHYSIDTETKKVTSLSDKPVNPAIKVKLTRGPETAEQWLWANFPDFAHKEEKAGNAAPLRLRYQYYDLRGETKTYLILTGGREKPRVIFSEDGNLADQELDAKMAYSLEKDYSFKVEQVYPRALLKTAWKNGTERLLHPALVAQWRQGNEKQEFLLELNQPHHLKTEKGMMVVLFRRVNQGSAKTPVAREK